MPKKSKLEMAGVLERAAKMHEEDHLTHLQIAEALQAEGYDISKSGVQRALRAKKLNEKEFKKKLDATKSFVEATKDTPGLQLAKAASDLLMSMLLTEIQGMEDLGSLKDAEIIDKIAKITKCQNDIAQTNLNYEKGYKAGLFKAQEALDDMKKTGVLSSEQRAAVMAALGVRE